MSFYIQDSVVRKYRQLEINNCARKEKVFTKTSLFKSTGTSGRASSDWVVKGLKAVNWWIPFLTVHWAGDSCGVHLQQTHLKEAAALRLKPCSALGLWCHQKWVGPSSRSYFTKLCMSTHRAKWVMQLSWWHLPRAVGFVCLTSSPAPSAHRSPSLRSDTATRPPKHGRGGWLLPPSLSLECPSLLFLQ